jgi:hypothetical protein
MGVKHSQSMSDLLTHSSIIDQYQFKNGIIGSGSLDFQPEIFNFCLDEENYNPISKIYLVEWHDPKTAQILQTKSDIDSFHNDDQITVSTARPSNSEYIINSPIVDPFQ